MADNRLHIHFFIDAQAAIAQRSKALFQGWRRIAVGKQNRQRIFTASLQALRQLQAESGTGKVEIKDHGCRVTPLQCLGEIVGSAL